MRTLCVIPARYASTRLPGKPLADICGKPMICRVLERASRAQKPEKVIVATDDERIYDAVRAEGGEALMTRADHPTGTDRLAEVAEAYPEVDLIVNVQGDEPLIEPSVIDELIAPFEMDENLPMATVMVRMDDAAEQLNPNNVKVIVDKLGYALYFSRSLVPYPRAAAGPVYKHIGIYAYRRDFLLRYARLEPTPLERAESLEQLRALENGYGIRVLETDCRFVGVDTPEDLALVNKIYREQGLA
ncbi:3-deoxy-manno-octulosonate cytidylyltransferase [Selenomonas sputigena]|uniref:3-deoxy-manno-octulosonate cytidylyltransferase n=1 Tax=Selenomonas sputigena (strain ATCC 35185 / DSM 20758 / CCUG 44933 / VPI D19B-28) TaxID=546271 RepID=C9LRN8_SELS3|nr:3-deoxy-manno-octulosonate cytidylyltransferase [Selenomonas sputigena]AEC00853.1 3-deoxy-D-manno-octulosonatecytidylyltransferase [Selenomonas sputigena ATCC 35185]EEX78504.1 3-deoxy-D-manno-octulosonate cytidylyltransferase [Selenomonas sputigena ATCC 35185]